MKNLKFIFFVFAIVFMSTQVVFAKTITNNNGIVISEEEYNNFIKIHNHGYIMNITKEKYERLKELDYNDIKTETKYVLSTYNPYTNETIEREVTESEFNNMEIITDSNNLKSIGDSTRGISTGSTYHETTGKKLTMAVIGGGYWNYVTLTARWKKIPATRSFDVIGIRGNGIAIRNGSQEGQQTYYTNGQYKYVSYSWNGTNIKRFDNGFGISMNLVDNQINYLVLDIECDVRSTVTHPELFGSYQHATSNLTLAQSQNYTLGGSGLGGVFVYPYNISSKYDHMAGVYIAY